MMNKCILLKTKKRNVTKREAWKEMELSVLNSNQGRVRLKMKGGRRNFVPQNSSCHSIWQVMLELLGTKLIPDMMLESIQSVLVSYQNEMLENTFGFSSSF